MITTNKIKTLNQLGTWVAHVCNPSYLGGWDQENQCLRPAHTNSSWDSISKTTRAKWTWSVAQVTEHLLCKSEALSSNSGSHKNRYINNLIYYKKGYMDESVTISLKISSCTTLTTILIDVDNWRLGQWIQDGGREELLFTILCLAHAFRLMLLKFIKSCVRL
jgi:hypothetical protein